MCVYIYIYIHTHMYNHMFISSITCLNVCITLCWLISIVACSLGAAFRNALSSKTERAKLRKCSARGVRRSYHKDTPKVANSGRLHRLGQMLLFSDVKNVC